MLPTATAHPSALARKGTSSSIDSAGLERELRHALRGEVAFDGGTRALYATDASNYRQPPIGVVLPRDADDVVAAVEVCRRFGAPLLPRGGGTSLAGQCCNVAVVLDCSRYMTAIVALDAEQRWARVQPGLILDSLRDRAEQQHLTFGPDPATHSRCTLGGMIGNNSCGVHSLTAGMTSDNVDELDVLLYDGTRLRVGATDERTLQQIIAGGGRRGTIYGQLRALRDRYADLIRQRYPDIPRRVSGYNLPELLPENGFNVARALVGSEGTCVTLLEATVRLVASPPHRAVVVAGFPDIARGCDRIPQFLEHKPIGLEGFDGRLVDYMRRRGLRLDDLDLLPRGDGWLLVEFGGASPDEAGKAAQSFVEALQTRPDAPDVKLFTDPAQQRVIWKVRESALGATAYAPGLPDAWPGWEDSAVPPARLGDYLRALRALLNRYGYDCSFYGHFGQGCVHTRIDFDFTTAAGTAKYRTFMEEAAHLVLRFGGSLSGEHGDGQARAELLPKMFGDELVRAFGEFKAIWDPDNHMNPGKLVAPYRMDENLRLGVDYRPARVTTQFAYEEDHGSFAHALLRCVGAGLCRRLGSDDPGADTMCPSYMVTRDERHSTRGRAHTLFEVLRGELVTHGWRDPAAKEALDLCLACKGCKSDCPVNVDMATYKAEFLSHYYAGRLRPRSAYAFGLIDVWARLAARMPRLVNTVTQTPLLRDGAKLAAGMARTRRVPAFAPEPFTAWFRRRGSSPRTGRRVILWPDTFNNYFHPRTAIAAVEVLEAAGFEVVVPEDHVCCGRPLYDYGMLDRARAYLQHVLDVLRPEIAVGTPVVGLEPSCVAVFRDELTGLLPHDQDARRLAQQVFLLSELLQQHAADAKLPELHRRAIVQPHCHHKAVMKLKDEQALLDRIGLDYEILTAGCCGMAGSFGFEAGARHEVSVAAGERVLLPRVRAADDKTLIIADGFSCREQIRQGSDRTALHVAELLQLALHDGPNGPPEGRPERGLVENAPATLTGRQLVAGAALATVAAALLIRRRGRKRMDG